MYVQTQTWHIASPCTLQLLPVPVADLDEHHRGDQYLHHSVYLHGDDVGEGRPAGLWPPEEAGLAEEKDSTETGCTGEWKERGSCLLCQAVVSSLSREIVEDFLVKEEPDSTDRK